MKIWVAVEAYDWDSEPGLHLHASREGAVNSLEAIINDHFDVETTEPETDVNQHRAQCLDELKDLPPEGGSIILNESYHLHLIEKELGA